jgi:hypothetical protein
MKTITSLIFDPPQGRGTIYARHGAFTESISVVLADLPENQQATVAEAMQLLSAQLPEGTALVERIGLERSAVENVVVFGVEAVAKNAAGGVAVLRVVSPSEDTTAKLDQLWNELQASLNA